MVMPTSSSPFSARTQARKATMSAELKALRKHLAQKSEDLQWSYSNKDDGTRKIEGNPGLAATMYVIQTLSEYTSNANMRPRYLGMQREAGTGQYGITEGVIDVSVEMAPLGGMKQVIEVPVIVRAGRMLQPGVFMHQGSPYIISKSSMEQLLDDAKFSNEVKPSRPNMFSPPAPTQGMNPPLMRWASIEDTFFEQNATDSEEFVEIRELFADAYERWSYGSDLDKDLPVICEQLRAELVNGGYGYSPAELEGITDQELLDSMTHSWEQRTLIEQDLNALTTTRVHDQIVWALYEYGQEFDAAKGLGNKLEVLERLRNQLMELGVKDDGSLDSRVLIENMKYYRDYPSEFMPKF